MNKKILVTSIIISALGLGILGAGTHFSSGNNSPVYAQKVKNVKAFLFSDVNTSANKTDIQTAMLNAIDNYKTVTGSLDYYSQRGNFTIKTDFQVDLSAQPKSYEKIVTLANNARAVSTDNYQIKIYDGKQISMYNSSSKSRNIKESVQSQVLSPATTEERKLYKGTTIKERIGTMEGQKLYNYRIEPSQMSGTIKTSLLPEDIAMGFLEDTSKWNITSKEKIAGVNTVAIEGTLNQDYTERFGANQFTINVDPNTGIMLQMEVKKVDGTIVESLHTNSITIDQLQNQDLFDVKEVK